MKITVVSLIIVLGGLPLATADTTLNQLPSQIWADPSDEGIGPPPTIRAENFTVSTGGLGFGLEQVVIWGGYHPGNTPLPVDNFGVVVHQDATGLPGTVVCSETGIIPTSRTLTGFTYNNGVDQYMYVIDLAAACSLSDGTYWVEVYNNSGSTPDFWFWDRGTLDPVNGVADSSYTFRTPPVWYPSTAIDSAMQLNGATLPVELQSFSVE